MPACLSEIQRQACRNSYTAQTIASTDNLPATPKEPLMLTTTLALLYSKYSYVSRSFLLLFNGTYSSKYLCLLTFLNSIFVSHQLEIGIFQRKAIPHGTTFTENNLYPTQIGTAKFLRSCCTTTIDRRMKRAQITQTY